MDITLNGKPCSCAESATVASLLAAVHTGNGAVVVEVNETIIPGEEYAATPLAAGDVVEIVHFVGGG